MLIKNDFILFQVEYEPEEKESATEEKKESNGKIPTQTPV